MTAFDFEPTPAQRELQALSRALAADVLAPRAAALDREGGFPHDNLATLARHGLLGVNVPKALGGLEAGAVAYSMMMTEIARACASTTVAVGVSNMVAEVICKFGTAEQQREHVPKLCDGRYVVGAFALSESGAGSDPAGMRTRARRTDRGWVLDGTKMWISSGTDAGLFVVWARTGDGGARGISAFLVPGDAPGLVRGKPEHKMGLRGSTTTPLELHGCEVGADALLDEEGRGFRIAMMALDGGRIGIGSQALGIGLCALDAFAAWVREEGGAQAASQHVQWALADSAVQLDAARLLTLRAAWLKERGENFTHAASMAKLRGSEGANLVCARVLEAMGPAALRMDCPVERCLRDVRVTMIYEGTSEVQRIVLGRDIARRFGERET
jgi:alkylation response protein AidB-like acyl-CoA dehydrogenase